MLLWVSAIALVGGVVYVAGFGVFDDSLVRVGALLVGGLIVIFNRSEIWPSQPLRMLVDLGLVVCLLLSVIRFLHVAEELETGLYDLTQLDVIASLCGLLVVLELTRRVAGLPLAIVCLIILGYGLFGEYLPGILRHAGVTVEDLTQTVWLGFDGVFGRAMAVVASVVLIFVVFGATLEAVGIGPVLLKLAFNLTARVRGGAAHAAVVGSALFGTLSGSAVANVVGTGVITIPVIKRQGFSGKFAGAVESAASTGGQLMPPVMGAVAFIMADMTGIPYLQVCIAAALPAFFYYAGLFAAVRAEAIARNIPVRKAGPEPDRLSGLEWLLIGIFILALGLIITIMIWGRSPGFAGFIGTVFCLVLGWLINPDFRSKPSQLMGLIRSAATASGQLIVIVSAVGIVIGVMNMTGLGLRFASLIQHLGEGSILLTLAVMAAGCLMLGMGMPTVPAYLVIILVFGPVVQKLGLSILQAHLFVVYFAVLSSVTPPVALSAFAAAPIAGASPMGVALQALKLSVLGFIIPFGFAFNESLLLIGTFDGLEFIWICMRLLLAIVLLSTVAWKLNVTGLLRLIAAIGLIIPSLAVQLGAVALALALLVWRWQSK